MRFGNVLFVNMMTSSNGNIFRVTGHLCGELTGPRWIPRTKVNDTELWCFSLICVWINGWVNSCEAGDLRGYRAHCDITVMNVWRNRYLRSWRYWNDSLDKQYTNSNFSWYNLYLDTIIQSSSVVLRSFYSEITTLCQKQYISVWRHCRIT